MSKLLVVVGATGAQGRAVIDYFQQHEHSYRLRGLTRNPTSDAAIDLSRKGVEIVRADLNDVDSLRSAFAGAHAIFAYTNFNDWGWTAEGMAAHFSGQRTLQHAFDEEVQQGKNIADTAAALPGLERLVWSTLPHVSKVTKGECAHLYHFDSKAMIAEYMLQKQGLQGKVSMAALGVFADNLIRLPPARQIWGLSKTGDGTYDWKLPMAGHTPVPWIDVPRDTGAFVSALLKAPAGLSVTVASEYMSIREYVKLWSSILGVKASFTEISLEEYKEDDPVGIMEEFGDGFVFFDKFEFEHGSEFLTPEQFEKKTGITFPRSKIADQIKRDDWSDVLK